MNNIPTGSTYYHQHTYYQFGECYARYYYVKKSCWRDSATVKNEDLVLNGIEIKSKGTK
jgi:hypothetical protein